MITRTKLAITLGVLAIATGVGIYRRYKSRKIIIGSKRNWFRKKAQNSEE